MTHPRVTKSSQSLQLSYELPYRIHTTKAYHLPSANGSKVVLQGHENGVNIIWNGGRPFKPTRQVSKAPEDTNGSANAVVSLDSDDEKEPEKPFDDVVEFEEEEELDPSRPWPKILQNLNLSFGTGVLHLAVLSPAQLKADGPSQRGQEIFRKNIIFVAACADSSVRLITLPLTPPSPASKARSDFRVDFTSAHAGNGKWGEMMVMLNGHQSPANSVSMTVELPRTALGKASEPHIIVASHSKAIAGLLLLHRVSLSPRAPAEPFQSIYLSSPARCISFNTALSKELSPHLLVADTTGVCRIYDYKLLIKTLDEPSDTLAAEKGTWLLSLYAGFRNTKNDSVPQNLGTHAGFGRKTIIDAQWVSGGLAVMILLDDGEWAIWDIEGVGPDAAKGLLGRQGIKGGSKTEYSLTGYLEGASKLRPSVPPQITASKFAPMTPGTRKSTEPFGSKTSNGHVHGQISVLDTPSDLATGPAVESILLWFGDTYSLVPNLAQYWAANYRKIGVTGNLFTAHPSTRMIKLSSIDLQGECCTGIEQLPKASPSSPSEIIIQGEHRYIMHLIGSKPAKPQPTVRPAGRLALTESTGSGGELDVVGIEQALMRMENGFGSGRKLF